MGYYVYIHTCKDNGKKYVGCTTKVNPELRWQEGNGYRYNKHFYSAILKYGWTNFEHEVFEVDSKEEMYRKEVELISFYHSNDPRYGYNNSSGGERSALGCTRSEEYRKKQSEVHKGKSVREETRKRISETLRKRCSDPGVQRKMSEASKKKWTDPGFREKVSKALKGQTRREETRKKMAEACKERWTDPEVRRKWSETCKNRPRIKIQLPDKTVIEITKQALTRWYINKGKKFEYVD